MESPEGFLSFVLVPKIHVVFCPKSPPGFLTKFHVHVVRKPSEFPDICFRCPKLMFVLRAQGVPIIFF